MKKTVLVDDLDGTEAIETLDFGFDGVMYEIDLSRGNAEKLRTALAPYAKVARPTRQANGSRRNRTPARVSKAAAPSPVKRKSRSGPSDSTVREWAVGQGLDVPKVGRVPKALREQFVAANGRKRKSA